MVFYLNDGLKAKVVFYPPFLAGSTTKTTSLLIIYVIYTSSGVFIKSNLSMKITPL